MTKASQPRIVVTGLGVVSPAGIGFASFARSLREGLCHTGVISRSDGFDLLSLRGAALSEEDVKRLSNRIPVHETLVAMMLADAAQQAIDQSGISGHLPVFLATVMGTRPALDQIVLKERRQSKKNVGEILMSRLGDTPWGDPRAIFDVMVKLGQTDYSVATLLSSGCSGGNVSLDRAAAMIESGESPVALAAAADEFSIEVFNIFSSLRALAHDVVRPFDARRDGTLPGEAATVLVLENYSHARARGAQILAAIEATSITSDAYHITTPHPQGRGLRSAILECLEKSEIQASEISWTCAHGTGTPANDALEIQTLSEVLEAKPIVSSIKGAFGHCQGAAAGLELLASIWSIQEQSIPATINLVEPDPVCRIADIPTTARPYPVEYVLSPAFGFGGTVSAAILRRFDE